MLLSSNGFEFELVRFWIFYFFRIGSGFKEIRIFDYCKDNE